MVTPVYTYDFTLRAENITKYDITDMLNAYCKKYCFQKERGDTGYIHYQGRFSLKERLRQNKILEKINTEYPNLSAIHIRPTTKQNTGNDFYVSKEETRIEGPWKDTDDETYIPKQIRNITLYQWQQTVVNDANVWNTRNINWVIDINGNNGKSILKTHIGVHKIGRALPYSNDFRDICRMVMATPPTKLYIIDLPRAISKDHLYQFTSGIETLKDGYAYDDRYSFKERYFDCPNIWIFSNTAPDRSLLSNDRWIIWNLNNRELTLNEEEI